MRAETLQKHIVATYFSLRVALAFAAFALPLLLWVGGRFYGVALQDSMSAYYHATTSGLCPSGGGVMRDWFVGVLFAVGALLYAYRGYSDLENITLNIAGVLAIGIALFPMKVTCEHPDATFTPHGTCAFGFFICIAFVCVVCAPNTLPAMRNPPLERRYKRAYRIIGAVMLGSPGAAVLVSILLQRYQPHLFAIEMFGIYAFAVFWALKSYEIKQSQADHRAARGELQTDPRSRELVGV